jgi:phosphoribosylformylglycinamidine cyclo-ligase
MFHTFNMGIGMVLVLSPRSASRVLTLLAELGQKAWVIGELIEGNNSVEII